MNWKYKIQIKNLFVEDNSDINQNLIETLCPALIIQIKEIQKDLPLSIEKDLTYLEFQLEDIIQDFEFLKDLSDGNIPREDWLDYEFEGDFKELFNSFLDKLYALGDLIIINKNNKKEKFIWIY